MSLPARYNAPRDLPQLTDHNLVAAIESEQRWHAFEPDWRMQLGQLVSCGFVRQFDGHPARAEQIAFVCDQLRKMGRLVGCEQTGWRKT
jgi:hypothetical protein